MSKNKEQNGRQRPSSSQPPLPSGEQRNVSDQKIPICRKYVWGTCNKGKHCKFRHELVFDEMKEILKFCHDYQNKQGCTRLDCSYLHTTSEEENLFLTIGQLPRVLQERYAAIHAEPTNCMPSIVANIPPLMFMPAPPPPPPPPTPLLPAAPPPPPPPPTPSPVQQQPPVTLPLSTSTTSAVQAPPAFAPPPPFLLNQPPPTLPPMFDASRPPPPIPGPGPGNSKPTGVKRKQDFSEAGPSKSRKPEEPIPADSSCENCIQTECRIEVMKKNINKLQCQEECQRILYKMRLDEYEKAKDLLRNILTAIHPDIYRQIEEYIEGPPPQVPDIFTQLTQNPIIMLMEYIFLTRSSVDSTSSSNRLDETLIQALSVPRRTQPIRQSSSPDLLVTIMEMLRTNTSTLERSQVIESRSLDSPSDRTRAISSVSGNGLSRLTNGQKMDESPSLSPANSSQYVNAGSSSNRVYSGVGVPGPSGVSSRSNSRMPVATSPVYPQYHPGIPPPPSRPFFPQLHSPAPPNAATPNAGFSTPPRAGTPGPIQVPVRLPQEPVRLPQEPVRSPQVPVRPQQMPVRPQQVPVRPQQVPVRPPQVSVRPTQVPVRPSQVPVRPSQVPVRPSQVPARSPQEPARPPQVPARPPMSPSPSTMLPNVQYNQYMMGRFPRPPHYFPPFQ